jgi:biotin carboxyl carrier protein
MEFKVGDLAQPVEGEIISTLGNESILIKISGKEYILKLLKSGTNESEFILDHSFHHAKILASSSSEIKISIDGQTLTIKRHSKLTEVLEKSLSLTTGGGENILTSQIPGRVVSILAKPGASVKKGDALVILESMKMQVAVKAHKDGNVKEIRAKEGATVARHDVVAVIE